MSKPFCTAPFTNFYFKGMSDADKVLPCCEGRMDEARGKQTFDEWWTGDLFKDIRQKMLDGEPHEICTRCMAVEKNGGLNARAGYKQTADQWEIDNNAKLLYNVDNGTQLAAPIALDYRGSNLCNLKCRMCHPSNSSAIAKEMLAHDEYANLGYKASPEQLFKRGSRNTFIDTIPLDNIIWFKILGGEPLMQNEVYQALDIMLTKNPMMTNVVITTNGTAFTDRFLSYLDKFKSFSIRISLDGINETQEYVRTNGDWQKIMDNCNKLAKLANTNPSIRVGFSFVVQAYNAFQLGDIARFCIRWNDEHEWKLPFFAPVDQDWMSTAILTTEDVSSIVQTLNDVMQEYPDNAVAPKILEIVTQFDARREFDRDQGNAQWVAYTTMQDTIRNTDISTIDKRFTKYIK